MPNPFYEPIIGRDFSDIGAQRYAWAGFNANIEAQNLARAAAAEQAQNAWALTNAQMAREDAARQAAIDANARNVALNLALTREDAAMRRRSELEQAARQEKQFGEQMAFAREDLAARGEQAKEKANLLEEQQKARIDFNGERFAAAYGVARTAKATADAALEAAQNAFDRAEADLSVLNTKTKRSEEEIARQMALSTSLPKLKADLRLATSTARAANADVERIQARLTAGDYDWNDSTGKITHPLGSREWSFAKAVSEAGGGAPKPLTPPPAAAVKAPGAVSNWFATSSMSPYVVGRKLGDWIRAPKSVPARPTAPVIAPAPVETAPGLLNPTPAEVANYGTLSRYAPSLLPPEPNATVPADFTPKMPLDRQTAQALLNEAKGDRALARQLANERGYTWPTY